MQSPETQTTLKQIPLGGRLLVRSRKDWRFAVISRIGEDQITLSICSPTGLNYRLRREPDAEIGLDGCIPVLIAETGEKWRENFSNYDLRW